MNYALRVLTLKKYDWESIKDKWEQEVSRHGPFQEAVYHINDADKKINDLEAAIIQLNQPPQIQQQ